MSKVKVIFIRLFEKTGHIIGTRALAADVAGWRFRVMALELSKIAQINLVGTATFKNKINGSSSNLVYQT